jgi:hypothetical protein
MPKYLATQSIYSALSSDPQHPFFYKIPQPLLSSVHSIKSFSSSEEEERNSRVESQQLGEASIPEAKSEAIIRDEAENRSVYHKS